nr:PREDICTED: tetraspanin-5 [Struthio camelus australis]
MGNYCGRETPRRLNRDRLKGLPEAESKKFAQEHAQYFRHCWFPRKEEILRREQSRSLYRLRSSYAESLSAVPWEPLGALPARNDYLGYILEQEDERVYLKKLSLQMSFFLVVMPQHEVTGCLSGRSGRKLLSLSLLCSFTGLLFLGIAFLGIGLWAWNEKGVLSNISSITDLGGFDPVWLFLVVGGVMFILGFAGCIGALRENTFLLKFFSVFLGIIFFLELTAGVLAFVFKDWIKDQLYFFINNNIRAYRDDIDLQNLIDFTQEYWQCCGAFGADDWNLNIYFNCTDSNASRERCGVPFSCCTKDPAEDVINTQCGYDARQKPEVDQQIVIYTKGCVPQFEKWLQDNLTIVAGIFIGIALLQIFGICLAQNLVSDIEAVRASW